MKAFDYVTNKNTGTVHLASQHPACERTLCGQKVAVRTHEWGDETVSGHAATCESCRTKYQPSDTPREGIDRCWCGAKYWDGTTCASCGAQYDPRSTEENY